MSPVAEAGIGLPPRPYPGLRPFGKDEWPIFFGRERMADEVIDRLIRQRMIFVHGDSGCGKSSLIRAGVLARLEQGDFCAGWRTAACLPREAPLRNVAQALAALAGDDGDEAALLDWRRALNGAAGAAAAIAELRRARGAGPGCLLIDQFEELFQHARLAGPDEALLLVSALISLNAAPPEGLYIGVTMRSEYLGACARFGGFAELVNATQYLLPRMGHDDMLRAIREPALLYDGQVSRELAERLIADTGGNQDQLPLIQHGLMRLYLQKAAMAGTGWQLGIADYPTERGLAGLLSDHADEVLKAVLAGLDSTDSRLVEDMFRALTDINTDSQAIRRPQTRGQLDAVTGAAPAAVDRVIAAFGADGVSFLSVQGTPSANRDGLVDVGHEALIRCWKVLGDLRDGWLIREFRNGLVWRALLVQAESFERDPRNVLSAATVGEREKWMQRRNAAWAARYGGGWERVRRLVDASAAERDRVAREQEETRLKEARAEFRAGVQRRWLAALGVVVVGMAGALWYAFYQLEESRLQFAANAAARDYSDQLVSQLDAEKQRAQALEEALHASASTLTEARSELQSMAGGGQGRGEWRGRLDEAASRLESQAGRLGDVVKDLAKVAPAPAASAGPRLYVHIAAEAQRGGAEQLEAALERLNLDRGRLVVPGVEVVKAYPSRAVLRCFDAVVCREQAPRLLGQINARLDSPLVQLEDLSERYGGKGVRPDQYELWFPPGDIRLRSETGIGSYNVDVFYCEATRERSEPLANLALGLKSAGDTGRWRVRSLSESKNREPGYGITGNVIRFTPPDERPVADALARLLKTKGIDASLQEVDFPTPGLVSVFLCR